MKKSKRMIRSQEGGTLAIVAVTMVALLAMIALAVDIGMAFTARSEAQRIADAAALAGGSAFLDFKPAPAVAVAEDRAYDYALRNVIRNVPVDSSQVTVQVDQVARRVRVWITRGGLPTWFARVLGIRVLDVAAYAAAEATDAGTARCLKPFAVPDVWEDMDDDTQIVNQIWDQGEDWIYEPSQGDRYERYDGDPLNTTATGLGSAHRDGNPDANGDSFYGDYGRPIQVKMSDPNTAYQPAPGLFLPWRIPFDSTIADCDKGGGGTSQGGAVYRRNICSCNTSPVELGVPYPVEPGNMIGPTDQGVQELLDEDPNAEWLFNPATGRYEVYSPNFGGFGLASPRVMKVALFDANQITQGGMQDIEFNNFALMFLEPPLSKKDPVMARFMYYVAGDDDPDAGQTGGSLVLVLRLVE